MKAIQINELDEVLEDLDGWELRGERLFKEFMFDHFPMAVIFVNKLVNICEEFNHHPEIIIKYNRVHLYLFTHQIGSLSDRDINLAKEINLLK